VLGTRMYAWVSKWEGAAVGWGDKGRVESRDAGCTPVHVVKRPRHQTTNDTCLLRLQHTDSDKRMGPRNRRERELGGGEGGGVMGRGKRERRLTGCRTRPISLHLQHVRREAVVRKWRPTEGGEGRGMQMPPSRTGCVSVLCNQPASQPGNPAHTPPAGQASPGLLDIASDSPKCAPNKLHLG
jgi:hypothetical protein